MKIECFTTRRAMLGLALYALGSIPAHGSVATFVSSNVNAQPIGGPGVTQGTGIPGQGVSLNIGNGQSVAAALTDYGVNHAQSSSSAYNDGSSASSDWQIGFTLSGLPTSFYTLGISYSYDFSITTSSGFGSPSTGYNLGISLGIAGNNGSQGNLFEILTVNATSDADGSLESCRTRFPLNNPGPQACLGSYAGSGTVTPANNFHGGDNRLEVLLAVQSALGVADAYNTAMITGIVVPDGVTWAYDDNSVTGNPLNFHYASAAAVPEPGTLSIFGLGLIATSLAGRRKWQKSARNPHL